MFGARFSASGSYTSDRCHVGQACLGEFDRTPRAIDRPLSDALAAAATRRASERLIRRIKRTGSDSWWDSALGAAFWRKSPTAAR